MNIKILYVLIFIAFIITFVGVFIRLYPDVEETKDILTRTLVKYDHVPDKNMYYTVNHKTGHIYGWVKPKGD